MLERPISSPAARLAVAPPPIAGNRHRFSPAQVEQLLSAAICLGAAAQGVVDARVFLPKLAGALLEQPSAEMRRVLQAMGYALPDERVQ